MAPFGSKTPPTDFGSINGQLSQPAITPDDAQRIAQAKRNTDGLAWLGLFVGAIVGFLAWMACIYVIHITGAEITKGLSVAVTVGCIILGFGVMLKVMTLGDVKP